jgi:hypothetical protein
MRDEKAEEGSKAQTKATPESLSARNSKPIYFPVSLTKLVVMNFCTWGVYQFYWFYENWKLIQEREQSEISPFWRTFFAFIYCYVLFQKVQSAATSLEIRQSISPNALASGWLLLSLLLVLPDPYWLVNFLSVFFLIPVQQNANRINESLVPGHDRNERFSFWNKVAVAIGGVLFIVGITGVFLHIR